jgi:hypothetical protein
MSMSTRTAVLSLVFLTATACSSGTKNDQTQPTVPAIKRLTVEKLLNNLAAWTPYEMQEKLLSNLAEEDPLPCDCDYNQYWGELPPWLREGPGPFRNPYICTTPPAGTDSCMTFEWCGDPAMVPDWQWKDTAPDTSTEMSKEKFGPDPEGHIYCLRYMKHSWRR